MMKRKPLREFRPLQVNPNKHTPRGMKLLEDAIRRDGYVAPMTAAADGTIIDGNARLETVATAMPSDPIVIEHDGRRPIIAIRTDIPDADDPRAKRIAIAANRIAEVDLEWDKDVFQDCLAEIDMSGLFSEKELAELVGADDGGRGLEPDIPEQWLIVVTCKDEAHQRELLDRFLAEGLRCRAVAS